MLTIHVMHARAQRSSLLTSAKRLTALLMAVALVAPTVPILPGSAEAAPPLGSALLFADQFGTTGFSPMDDYDYNKWNDGEGGWSASSGEIEDIEGSFTVRRGSSGMGLLLEGSDGSNPDAGAQRDVATKGHASLYVEYSRAWDQNGNSSGDDTFVVEYALDGGSFTSIESVSISSDASHASTSITIPNPNRHTKLTLRFYVNGDNPPGPTPADMVGIDNVLVYGSDAPLFYDGFESGLGLWNTEEAALIDTDSAGSGADFWTDNSAVNGSQGRALYLEAAGTANPDGAVVSDPISTVGKQGVIVRVARKAESIEPSDVDSFRFFVSTTSVPAWTPLETLTDDTPYASVTFSLPASADNNPDLRLRFEVNGNTVNDWAFVDDVVVWGAPLALGHIEGEVLTDSNGNGVNDDGGVWPVAWDVIAINALGATTTVAKYPASSGFAIANVPAGTYTVCTPVAFQPWWAQTLPNAATGGAVPCGNGHYGYQVVVTSGATTTLPGPLMVAQYGALEVAVSGSGGTLPSHAIGVYGGSVFSAATATVPVGGGTVWFHTAAGTFDVFEEIPAGWYVASNSCVAATVTAGATSSCAISLEKYASIEIGVATSPSGDPETFDVTGDYFAGTATLTDGASTTTEGMLAGTYTANIPDKTPEWDLASFTCSDGTSATSSLVLSVGEDLSCTATYVKRGSVTVTKMTDPAIGSYQFDIDDAGIPQTYAPASTTFTPGGTWTFEYLKNGTYALSETVLSLPDSDPTWARTIACNGDGVGFANDPYGSIATTSFSLALDPGENISCTVNNTQNSVITGRKFEDLDGTGASTTGSGLSGWTITATRLTDDPATPDVDESTTTPMVSDVTDTNGEYSFVLTPGTYRVCESPEPNWYQSYPSAPVQNLNCNTGGAEFDYGYEVTVSAGEVLAGQDFGNYQYGSVAGFKWNDADANAVLDGGELGINGWEIQLFDQYMSWLDTETTAAGTYTFTSVPPGTYYVGEVLQSGWAQSFPGATANYVHQVVVTSGATIVSKDFGNAPDATISGTKYEDIDSDGDPLDGGDVALGTPTFTMTLYTIDGLGNVVDVVGSTSTRPDGTYSFTGLLPGSYRVMEQPNTLWMQTYPTNGAGHDVTLAVDEDATLRNFHNTRVSVVGGMKWHDADRSGSYDAGETKIAGWSITATPVTDDTGATVDGTRSAQSATTSALGEYQFTFTNAQLGWWRVSEEAVADWEQLAPATTTFDGDYLVNVPANVLLSGYDFGNWAYPTVEVFKWKDLDQDGVRDWTEIATGTPGVKDVDEEYSEGAYAGWLMALGRLATTTGGGAVVEIVDTALTNASGTATLAAPTPDTYYVFEGQQPGWTPTYPVTFGSSVNVYFAPNVATTSLVLDRYYTLNVLSTGGVAYTAGTSTLMASTTSAIEFGNFEIPAPTPAPVTTGGGGGGGANGAIVNTGSISPGFIAFGFGGQGGEGGSESGTQGGTTGSSGGTGGSSGGTPGTGETGGDSNGGTTGGSGGGTGTGTGGAGGLLEEDASALRDASVVLEDASSSPSQVAAAAAVVGDILARYWWLVLLIIALLGTGWYAYARYREEA